MPEIRKTASEGSHPAGAGRKARRQAGQPRRGEERGRAARPSPQGPGGGPRRRRRRAQGAPGAGQGRAQQARRSPAGQAPDRKPNTRSPGACFAARGQGRPAGRRRGAAGTRATGGQPPRRGPARARRSEGGPRRAGEKGRGEQARSAPATGPHTATAPSAARGNRDGWEPRGRSPEGPGTRPGPVRVWVQGTFSKKGGRYRRPFSP